MTIILATGTNAVVSKEIGWIVMHDMKVETEQISSLQDGLASMLCHRFETAFREIQSHDYVDAGHILWA